MENSGKQNPKMGFKPPRADEGTFKWLFLKNLGSKTLGQIQNLDPHRMMSRLKSMCGLVIFDLRLLIRAATEKPSDSRVLISYS
jgi:hypothetical protein